MFKEVIKQERLLDSEKFRFFVEKYREKIRGKVRAARKDISDQNEKLKDIRFELEIAYLLCKSPTFRLIEYEKFGKEYRNPDFTISDEAGLHFNIEVKRIRESDLEKRFKVWEKQVAVEVNKIPSKSLVFMINITDKQGREISYEPDLLDRLEMQGLDIIKYIIGLIPGLEKNLQVGEESIYSLPEFENEVKIIFSKPRLRKPSEYVLCRPSLRPIFYQQGDYEKKGEYRKFGDAICDGIGQIRPDMINFLAINSRSETHDDVDLKYALQKLKKLANEPDDNFFNKKRKSGKRLFDGASGFLEQFEHLNGILFINPLGTQEGFLLQSNADAIRPIPESIEKALVTLA